MLDRRWRILASIFIAIILVSSSLTPFQNFSLKSHDQSNIIQKAFATSGNGITLISNYAIFGLNGVHLESGNSITAGDVGAQNPSFQVTLESNSNISPGPNSALVGDSLTIHAGAVVNDVYYNHLSNSGTIQGTKNTPVTLPVVSNLPIFPTFTTGSQSITVNAGSSLILQPGKYNSITVGNQATLEFTGGTYNVTSIQTGTNSNLFFDQASKVLVKNQFNSGSGLRVGPSATSSIDASGIVFYVGSGVGPGSSSMINANIYAPNGEIHFQPNTIATGSFIGKTVHIEKNSIITLDSAFALPVITWIPSSLNIQAKPSTPVLLNFTASAGASNIKIIVSSPIKEIVTAQSSISNISSGILQEFPITISIPPSTSSGWHNGTITLSINGNQLSKSLNLNIFVPTITVNTVQTANGTYTYVATPSYSPFFSNTSDLSVYFTFPNGTTIFVRTYYDLFQQGNPLPTAYQTSSVPQNLFTLYSNSFGIIAKTLSMANIFNIPDASAIIGSPVPANQCTQYGITYTDFRDLNTQSNDISVANNALSVSRNPLIIRDGIHWNDTDHGSFDINGNWQPSYDDAFIDNFFNKLPQGVQVYVSLSVEKPPQAIADKGSYQIPIPNGGFTQVVGQYYYKDAANAWISHVINRAKTDGMLNRVAYWQIGNEPNLDPAIGTVNVLGVEIKYIDWKTTADSLQSWLGTVKSQDPGKPAVINIVQTSLPGQLQLLSYVNLLYSDPVVGQELANNMSIMGFDIYPDQWASPVGPALVTWFNSALTQAGQQITSAQTHRSFVGKWGIIEMADGPKPKFFPSFPSPLGFLTANVAASDVGDMINSARTTQLGGQFPVLIGLFQLRALDHDITGVDGGHGASSPPFNDAYGLIDTTNNGQTNNDFLNAIQSSVLQNCPEPIPIITSPTNGATVTTNPTINGTGLSGATITVYDGTSQIGTTSADPKTGNWSFSTSISPGSHTITATQTFNSNISDHSAPVTFTFTPPGGLSESKLADYYVYNNANGNPVKDYCTSTGSTDCLPENDIALTPANSLCQLTGLIDNSCGFFSDGQYGSFSNPLTWFADGTTSYSINTWINLDGSHGSGAGTLLLSTAQQTHVDGINIYIYRGSLNYTTLSIRNSAGTEVLDVTTPINSISNLNQWYMLTYTIDTTTNSAKIYINGQLAGQGSATGILNAFETPTWGSCCTSTGSTQPLGGKTDETSFWQRVLAPSEIGQLYNNGQGLSLLQPVSATLDLAVSNDVSNDVSILLGTGTGSFGTATSFAVGGITPISVTAGDFNGDGKLDLATANDVSNNVSILLGTGTGSFGTATNFAVGNTPVYVVAGDFNGDGKLDLAATNELSSTVSILLGNGDGTFGAVTTFAVGDEPIGIAVGDFNGDGKLDLAVSNASANSQSVSILLGTGTGSFGTATNFAVGGTTPVHIVAGDFNGDGKLDLATANENSNNVSILLGTGTGSFGPATTFAVGSIPGHVAIGDFNGDGKLDLATANGGSGNISILLGTGTGSFGTATNLTTGGTAPASVTVADLNGDGKLDLVVANQNSNNVAILLGTGTGSFGTATTFAVGNTPGSIAVGNFHSKTGVTPSVIATIPVGAGPVGLVINPNTNTLYATNEVDGTVSVINENTRTVTATIPTGGVFPFGLGVNPNTNTVYVSNGGSFTLTVINGNTNTVSTTLSTLGYSRYGVAVNPNTNTIYVTSNSNNLLYVLNGNTNTVTATVPVGSDPSQVTVNPTTNTIYVSNYLDNTISVIDGNTNTVTATIPVGSIPYGSAVNTVTNTIYVPNAGGTTVSVIDGNTNTVTATIPVGSNPSQVAVNPLTNTVYVSNSGGTTLSVINGNTNTVTATIPVGTSPEGIAINTATNTVYVDVGGTNTVAVIK